MDTDEIKNATFPRSVRGFNKESVRNFLSSVSDYVKSLKKEVSKLKSDNETLNKQLEEFRKVESGLIFTIEEVRNSKLSIETKAKNQAKEIISNAESQAKEIRENYQKESAIIKKNLQELKKYRDDIINSLKPHLEKYSSQLKEFSQIKIDISEKLSKTEERVSSQTQKEKVLDVGSISNEIQDENSLENVGEAQENTSKQSLEDDDDFIDELITEENINEKKNLDGSKFRNIDEYMKNL